MDAGRQATAVGGIQGGEGSVEQQEVGVGRQGPRIVGAPVPMQPRAAGASRIFRFWWVVGKYMLQTSLLCLARIGYSTRPPSTDP